MSIRVAAACALLLIAAAAMPGRSVEQAAVDGAGFPPTLNEFGFFGRGADDAAPTLIAYTLQTPLFSDYAEKQRYIHIPKGQKVAIAANGDVTLPSGSAIIKSFAFSGPNGVNRTVETRVMLRRADGWTALPYVMRADGEDADLRLAGRRIDVAVHHDGVSRPISYAVPNKNQCKECHGLNGAIQPIGLNIADMRFVTPADAAKFAAALPDGIAMPAMATAPVWNDPASGSLDARARTYLRINCGHCHRPGGSASNSGLFFTRDQGPPRSDGVWKRPVAAGRGSGGLEFDIYPGKPDASILLYRMRSLEPGIAMPEVGRAMVHDEGTALIREWIAAMPETGQ